MLRRLPLLMVLFVLGGAGCFSSDDTDSEGQDSSINDEIVFHQPNIPDTSEQEDPELSEEEYGPVREEVPLPVEEHMVSGNFFFSPGIIRAKPGQRVEIIFTENAGTHSFVIDEVDVRTMVIEGNAMAFDAPQTVGRYSFYCDTGSHRELGMEGVLIVE